ncbi:TlpA disulfide reductase family protein [Parapedobacter soli]|uniref:TlpA disulfide reductase family protein n=1 Tax=Parapedobacter soli TaxID=416955 RepID=UPI0021C68A20|nr:TlpA disulfide reductase family protein [Parapedobacter soli]
MKQKIRLGDYYTLSKHKLKQFKIRYISLLAVLTSMCLYAVKQASAQVAEPAATAVADIQPLQIGDTIPEVLWNLPLQVVNHTDGKDTITLNDYRDKKLIVLDFWATWCKSCIEGFPKLEAYQKKYADDLGVLLVNAKQTGDDSNRIEKLFSRYKDLHDYSLGLPYLSSDTVFQTLFPHRILPHMVWISGDGTYLAATYSDALTSANIESAFSGNVEGIHMKRDDDGEMQEITPQDNGVIYRSELTNYVEGAGFKSRRLTVENGHSIYRITNYSLRYIYNTAYNDVLSGIPRNQWVFNGVDTTVVRGLTDPKGFDDAYCYELRVPGKMTMDRAEDLLREDLERVFGVSVSRLTKDSRVLVLQVTPQIEKITTKGEIQQRQLNPEEGPIFFQNVALGFVLRYFSKLLGVPTVLVGHTGIAVDVTLPSDVASLDEKQLVVLLEQMGVNVREEKRSTEFAVFNNLHDNLLSTK